MSHHENTLRKALIIHGITRRYYEPGRQDRSLYLCRPPGSRETLGRPSYAPRMKEK